MSLWSPVDLVTGGTGQRNIRNNTSLDYGKLLELVANPVAQRLMSPAVNDEEEGKQSSILICTRYISPIISAKLKSNAVQNQSKQRSLLVANSSSSDESNASSDHFTVFGLKRTVMSNVEPESRKLIRPPSAHTGSHSKLTTSISNCEKHDLISKVTPSSAPNVLNCDNGSLHKRRLSESDSSESLNIHSDLKRTRVRDHLVNLRPIAANHPPSISDYHSSDKLQPMALLKLSRKGEHVVKCDNVEEQSTLNLAASNSSKNDLDVPLNLCTKKSSTTDHEKGTDSYSRCSSDSKNVDVTPAHSTITSSNSVTLGALPEPHQKTNTSSADSRKRGRRQKSILTSANNLPIIVVPAVDDGKPKKRGRPPILSPPPINSKLSELTATSSSDTLGNSHRLATLSALHLGSTNSHLLQPGWPTFTSSGVVIFPSTNENKVESKRSGKNNQQVEYSDVPSAGSGEESKRGDTDSEEDNDEDSDSDSQQSNGKLDGDENKKAARLLPDEKEIRLPLQFGWRRQTLIRCITASGIRGDVVYFTPCGKKLKSYPEVVKYLAKSNVNSITRDNFSYSPKITIGEFLEMIPGRSNEYKSLTEDEVKSRIEESRKSGRRRLGMKSARKRLRRTDDTNNLYATSESKALDYRTNEHTPNAGRSLKTKPTNEELLAMNMTKTNFNERELKNEIELIKRAQERELKRYQNEQELQKRRELQIMAEIERERRKQHILLVRALDAHKRQEERERKREEMLAEKRAMQERKLQKKRLEMELLKELKKPVDDMMLKDLQPLPTLNRIPGLKLTGKAFADVLMVYEFLHNFGETLGFDMESLPSLNTLQQAVLNLDDCAEEELLSIIHHLLVCVIDDPGIPFNITTLMGQKLKDAPITNYNITEILRLYFQSFATQIREDSPLERIEMKLFNILNTGRPFLSLNATHKAEILAFLCNELLCNQAIIRKIDDNIESVSNLRRDKWIVENDIRKYRAIKSKREKKSEEQEEEDAKKGEKSETEIAVGEESGYSDVEETTICIPSIHDHDEEPEMNSEELDKKLEVLTRKCTMLTNKLNKAIHGLRVNSLGQDRYHRRFWVLPAAGGVFIEGLQSGEMSESECAMPMSDEEKINEKLEDTDSIDQNLNGEVKKDTSLNAEHLNGAVSSVNMKSAKCEKNEETDEEVNENKVKVENASFKTEDDDKSHNFNEEVKQPKIENVKENVENNDKCLPDNKSETANNDSSSLSGLHDSPWLSPIVASVLAGSMMFGNSNSNHSSNGFPSFPFGFPIDLPHNSQKQSPRPWFSILPRMPCSKDTIIEENLAKTKLDESSDKEKSESHCEKGAEANSSRVGSLVNNLPTNLFMHAFLYPHILNSLFQQNRSLPNFPQNSTPQSSKIEASKCDSQLNSSLEQSQTRPPSPGVVKSDNESSSFLNTQLNETDICPALQKKLAEQREEQYNEPQPIPPEFQCGWWRITDPSQLKNLCEMLHERGSRERQLHKHLMKYFNYIANKCKSNAAELDITDLDRKISQECPFGAPPPQRDDEWSREVALKLDISVLEQIEALEEKIASSSMQIRGWRPPARISSDSSIHFEVSNSYAGEDYEMDEEEKSNCLNKKTVNPVKVGCERLLAAEAVIERRYLKPPLGFKSNTLIIAASASHNGDELADNAADENAPNGLLRWRDAVRECKTGSQLALLLHFLESCIAWDKSIMRASCQFCGSGENEAQLLLCDGCDKGYHTYCFKPKMETIPEGDWFCFECQNKNTIDKVCIVCGKKGKLLNCDTCPKVFHPNCIDPPVTKPPKGRWSCNMCNRKPKKPKWTRKTTASSTTTNEEKLIKEVATSCNVAKEAKKSKDNSKIGKTSKTDSSEKETKKDKKMKERDKELAFCDQLLSEMEKHDDAWPFLFPVNTKQFPTYKKIIKKPMDLAAIRAKVDNGSYKSRVDFMADCRLIFDNCETFNEDESPVGIAGHNMRAFWEKRSKELMEKM
ncbi:bromodomain adjacent to zinc finger domain protein 2B-like isoform X13 [Dinothrombium tinctorium]|uniref:Bromodomain adjacent to zinc finger domain protein 2B-like isoform X13 n=1 Tax=Dinothrombium tinctorium TaxID=1965070 RepID=A0A443R8J8_9ACAR|nr:bromodomain adjacent to zinc finger domain protein 2B-like isoform X13 [Dinothrombium tinctorium]